MIHCAKGVIETIRAHARGGYPDEVCGALLGRVRDGGAREAVRAVPVKNERTGGRERRYLISPAAVLELEREAARAALELVGFYHSHPDHPAVPSAYDREHAWPWYAYLIIEVRGGQPGALRAWRLHDDRSSFQEEPIIREEEEAS